MAYSPKHHVNNAHYQSLEPPNNTYTKCYNSLFEDIACCWSTPATYDALQSFTTVSVPISSSSFSDTDIDMSEVVDLTEAYTSCRFFISSPGRSNSIIDELPSMLDGGVAVEKYSSDPYVDFRRSMEEMVAARDREVLCEDVNETWDYLEELLLSYLALNPKETHKYIVRAFGDMVE